MSADVLREAAKLMRERASACEPDGAEGYSDWRETYWTDGAGGMDGQHIATFGHPTIALAVADWLDAEAGTLDALAVMSRTARTMEHKTAITGAAITVYVEDGGKVCIQADTSEPALAVARAYLGAAS